MIGFDSLITNSEIAYLPRINNYFCENESSFEKEIFNKAQNIAILKYLKKNK